MTARSRRVARERVRMPAHAAKKNSSKQRRTAARPPAAAARDYETVALVLQGGGALGAYQCGVYEGLHEAGLRPDCFAGISIGAINAAILAGNAPERRVERLREFWSRISAPALPLPRAALDWQREWLTALPRSTASSAWMDSLAALSALWIGQHGFFVPRTPPPFAALAGTKGATSFYSVEPLRHSLLELVDFDRINDGATRFAVGAVNVRSGNFAYFDNRRTRIRVEHVLASSALPPGFGAVEIDGEFYWDGGVVSNTPLEYVIGDVPRRDTLAFQVDLWSARGVLPRTLAEVLEREKDIQYSSRTRAGTDRIAELQRLRRVLGSLAATLPGKRLPAAFARQLAPWTCDKVLNIVHLIYQAKSSEEQYKDYAFGPATMREHWSAGLADMQNTLLQPAWFVRPADGGVATHDIHR
jgi:NTE family protein